MTELIKKLYNMEIQGHDGINLNNYGNIYKRSGSDEYIVKYSQISDCKKKVRDDICKFIISHSENIDKIEFIEL